MADIIDLFPWHILQQGSCLGFLCVPPAEDIREFMKMGFNPENDSCLNFTQEQLQIDLGQPALP